MSDEYGDPETDLDAAILDDTLRELFTDIPEEVTVSEVDSVAWIREAIEVAWPDGTPPSAQEAYADSEADTDFHTDLSNDWPHEPLDHGSDDATHDEGGNHDPQHDGG